tara:strand:- start:1071 stop:1382 length:312 start_codon:yes stop_codon:yes gene_type:complete
VSVTELLSNYGLPTLGVIAVSTFVVTLVTFLKSLLVKELSELKSNQQRMTDLFGKELRTVQDDVARIELMLRLGHDVSRTGKFQPEMSRIGKAGTDIDMDGGL